MTDKSDLYNHVGCVGKKFTAVLKKNFCDKFFAREKNSDDERFTHNENSARNENFAARKFSPQEKSRRNENSANNIIDNKNFPTTKRASSEAL